MLSLLRKKKLSEDKLANIFVNSFLDLVDNGFPEVAALINSDPEFRTPPQVDPKNSDQFFLIILAGNLKFVPQCFDNYQDVRLIQAILRKTAHAIGTDADTLKEVVSSYQSYFSRINHPSKNTHYAMSKALFFKYELNEFQEDYFRKMNTPNPIFLKRLDEIIAHFLWDWADFQEKYRIVE
ncbi:MAG: hypothetical protein AAGB22_09050 [Bacteroidota bacterium]